MKKLTKQALIAILLATIAAGVTMKQQRGHATANSPIQATWQDGGPDPICPPPPSPCPSHP